MELHFKDVSGKDNVGDFTWIHQSGRQAILADMVSGTNVAAGLDHLSSWLAEHQGDMVFEPQSLIKEVHQLFQHCDIQAAFGVLTKCEYGYSCYTVGNLRLYKVSGQPEPFQDSDFENQPTSVLGQASLPLIKEQQIGSDKTSLFMLTSDGLNSELVTTSKISLESLKSGNLYQQFLPSVADKDWSALIFPMSDSHSFVSQDWPYNPFVGPQEERIHEKRGLAEIATELFKCPQFDGFRIVSCPPVLSDNASRLFDGLLVYPYGVIPLELKDHHGQIKIDMATNKRQSLFISNDRGETYLANPVQKLRESLRRFGDLKVLKGLDPMLKNAGLVVFTSPNACVDCVFNGEVLPAPFSKAGEVMVAQTHQLTEMLLGFCKGRFGKKLKARLDESEINRLVEQLVNSEPESSGDRLLIGDYQCSSNAIDKESTDYYQVYDAWVDGDHLWAKCFSFDHLSSVHRQAEIQSLGREAQILKRLGRRRINGVQFCDGREVTEDKLYVFLKAAPQVTLTDWLKTSPSRQERIELLISLAEVLEGIQSVGEPQIIHRAINPSNIRIDTDGYPLLINFELCQLETVATLPINARRTFEQKYQAPEVNEPGQSLTYAADIYSLGLIAFELLVGKLPFSETPKELIAKGRRPVFWASLCKELGIPTSDAKFLHRILHNTAKHRPEIDEVLEVFKSWND